MSFAHQNILHESKRKNKKWWQQEGVLPKNSVICSSGLTVAIWAEDLVLKLHNGEYAWVSTRAMEAEGIPL